MVDHSLHFHRELVISKYFLKVIKSTAIAVDFITLFYVLPERGLFSLKKADSQFPSSSNKRHQLTIDFNVCLSRIIKALFIVFL